jgi:hypothetical protein
VSEGGSVYKSMSVCVRTWKYVSEGGSVYKSVEVCQNVEVCVRAKKYA